MKEAADTWSAAQVKGGNAQRRARQGQRPCRAAQMPAATHNDKPKIRRSAMQIDVKA
jgi:hypothetical protein